MPETTITLLPDDRRGTIPPELFGHMIEFVGRCVYDGVWVGEDSAIPNDDGLRLDTIAALRQLRAATLRLGGSFGEYYHWRDAIGPRDRRPRTRNLFWGGYETNHFGTDEFLRWCALIGAAPIIQINVATGSRQEALDWMEYCNGVFPSSLAEERAGNGHAAPYGVKYWQIGNENLILHTAEEYAREVTRFGTYMRQAEPDGTLIVRGTWNLASDYNQRLLAALAERLYLVDLLSMHCYTYPPPLADDGEADTYAVVAGAELVERQIRRAAAAIDLYAAGKKRVGIIVDEYGAHHHETMIDFPVRAVPNGLQQPGFLRDAILAARVLHVFMRHNDRVAMANLSISINAVHAALKTAGPRLVRTPTFHVLDLLKEHMNGTRIRVAGDPGDFTFTHAGDLARLPHLDVIASVTPDGNRLVVSLVNPHLERAVDVRLRLDGDGDDAPTDARATVLAGPDPLAQNDADQPDQIRPVPTEVIVRGADCLVRCAPFSLTVVTLQRPIGGN